jgi:hypothetical protein
MAYQKINGNTACNIIPRTDGLILNPSAAAASGTSTSVGEYYLIDSNASFITSGYAATFQSGDYVVNLDTGQSTGIISVGNNTQLYIGDDIFTSVGQSYAVIGASDKTAPCVLYIGEGGNVSVRTASGNNVVFADMISGSFLPVNVTRVFNTSTAASFVAIW